MHGKRIRRWTGTSRMGSAIAVSAMVPALMILAGSPARAADCPPDRPLCRLFTSATPTTTTAPAPIVNVPSLPPVTVLPPPPPPSPAAPRSVPEAARRLLELVNGERAKAGLPRLTSREDVVRIALAHSQRMAASGTIFHNDSYFTDAVQRLLNSKARGENVAQNSSVDDTHARLMNSPGHRANILDPRFTVAGFAVIQASDGRYYTTQAFLQPAGAVAPVAPAPAPRAPAASRPATTARAPVAVAGPAIPVPSTDPVPVTVVEAPAAPAPGPATLAGLAVGRRSPAASAGPDLAGRHPSTVLVLPAALLVLVALGVLHTRRRTRSY